MCLSASTEKRKERRMIEIVQLRYLDATTWDITVLATININYTIDIERDKLDEFTNKLEKLIAEYHI